MIVQPFAETLIEHIEEDIDRFREYGADAYASALRNVVEIIRDRADQFDNEVLTLEESAEASRYSYSALQKKVRNAEIPNAGEKGSPRIRRKYLPFKGPEPTSGVAEDGPNLTEFVA